MTTRRSPPGATRAAPHSRTAATRNRDMSSCLPGIPLTEIRPFAACPYGICPCVAIQVRVLRPLAFERDGVHVEIDLSPLCCDEWPWCRWQAPDVACPRPLGET